MSQRVRAAVVRVIDHADATTVIGPRGALRFDGDSASLLRAVLEIHGRPVTTAELYDELARQSGGEVPTTPVEELIALLEQNGVLVAAPDARPRPAMLTRRVVLGISGAVAAVDAPVLVRGLHAMGCQVRIALTRTAQRFVAVPALEALTHQAAWRGLWQRDERCPVPHINLAEWAELVIVWPASATTLARIANGDCSDLVSAIATATRAPVVIAPSMNDAMYGAPAVQANLDTLRAHGRWIVHPTLGVEVAHAPGERRAMFGPAAPPSAMLDIVRHLMSTAVRPELPQGRAGWEMLWSATAVAELDRLPWHVDQVDPPIADALAHLAGDDKRLLDLGTGAGVVAIEAARRGFAVTASDISASALGHAQRRAGDLPILFVLDDITRTRLSGRFDVTVDVGLLHCLPVDARPAYADAVTALTAPGGTLLVAAHQPGVERATHPLTELEVRQLLSSFELVRATPSTLARANATLYELRRGA